MIIGVNVGGVNKWAAKESAQDVLKAVTVSYALCFMTQITVT
jgi:hypothetical protein